MGISTSLDANGLVFGLRLVDPRRRLQLVWRETGGPPPAPPARRGFGSRLIERNVRHDLAGEVELDYAGDGLVATFSIPLDREQTT